MSCTIGEAPPVPTLPLPFTVTPPALPPLPGIPTLCCQLVAIPPIPPLPPFPPGVSAAFNAIITEMMSSLLPYFDALTITLPCPKAPPLA
jgi:hypothetical protein